MDGWNAGSGACPKSPSPERPIVEPYPGYIVGPEVSHNQAPSRAKLHEMWEAGYRTFGIRTGFGTVEDREWREWYELATEAGFLVYAWHYIDRRYSGWETGQLFARLFSEKSWDMPAQFDVEVNSLVINGQVVDITPTREQVIDCWGGFRELVPSFPTGNYTGKHAWESIMGNTDPADFGIGRLLWFADWEQPDGHVRPEKIPAPFTVDDVYMVQETAQHLPGYDGLLDRNFHPGDSSTLLAPMRQSIAQPKFGLHGSADPSNGESDEFITRETKPGMMKVLSFIDPDDLRILIAAAPNAKLWIVRAFLEFGGRAVTPEQFVLWTRDDLHRTVGILKQHGLDVVIELHNEPNLVAEGLNTAWRSPDNRELDLPTFSEWGLDVLSQLRREFPNVPFAFPGLSPGSGIPGTRQAHWSFWQESAELIAACDMVCIHVYWGKDGSDLSGGLNTVDWFVQRTDKPIIISECSHNGSENREEKSRQYITFWQHLHTRPQVKGVCYFVLSSNSDFVHETWTVSMGAIAGERTRP